jgi:hypothetical protein
MGTWRAVMDISPKGKKNPKKKEREKDAEI